MCRGIACDGTSPGGFRLSASVIRTRSCGLAWLPKVGAGCGKSARPVLCGGRRATVVPTATVWRSVFLRPTFASAARQARISRCLAASSEREGAGTRYAELENGLSRACRPEQNQLHRPLGRLQTANLQHARVDPDRAEPVQPESAARRRRVRPRCPSPTRRRPSRLRRLSHPGVPARPERFAGRASARRLLPT